MQDTGSREKFGWGPATSADHGMSRNEYAELRNDAMHLAPGGSGANVAGVWQFLVWIAVANSGLTPGRRIPQTR